MFRQQQEESSRLQAVFSKLSGVLPREEDHHHLGNGNAKLMSTDIIESVLGDTPVSGNTWNFNNQTWDSSAATTPDALESVSMLTLRLEQELRAAKSKQLSCAEVLLPCGLLRRVALDVRRMAESEPCGIRGCRLFLLFQDAEGTTNRIGAVQLDPTTECTFELYLTLKQSSNGWHFLPQFIRNLTRGGTVVISPAYTLSKKKLYRSYAAEQGEIMCKTD